MALFIQITEIAASFRGGEFSRNAPHVLQVVVGGEGGEGTAVYAFVTVVIILYALCAGWYASRLPGGGCIHGI